MNDAVLDFLQHAGLVRGASPHLEALSGGVSSDIWRVDLPEGPICVKRALPRLRVEQLWEAPIERNHYERLWMQTANAAAPGSAPRVIAWDDERGLFAMEYLDFPVWKSVLRAGRADRAFAAQVGATLGAIHAATATREEVRNDFQTDAIFHAIRLEPYLVATAARQPSVKTTLISLEQRTGRTKRCLVHGDVSPKNILVTPRGPVFLDAECAWYGDPAFDVAFCLNHMFLKCIWMPQATRGFLECFDALAAAYLARVDWEPRPAVEERAATLLPGLLLGRIDGKSPVEYLDDAQRHKVRKIALSLLASPVQSLEKLRRQWQESLT